MKQIVNAGVNWAIGVKGQLLAYIPEDMKFFRQTTKDAVVIMGRKTLDSFPGGKPLKGRVNIVITSDPEHISREAKEALVADWLMEGSTELLVAASPEEAAEMASQYADREIFVIGGETIYRALLPYCDTCLVTMNDKWDEEADAFYPDLDETGEWELVKESETKEYEGIRYYFTEYKRIQPQNS